MAPTTIQPKLHQEKEINAPHFDTVGDRLFPRLRALCGLVHKSYTMSTRNLGLRVYGHLLKKQYLVILVLVSTLFLSFEATPVFAGTPTITNVVLWNNGGNTTLNVTISHFPAGTSQHHVDAIEANISGAIETLMVPVESTTEFTIVFDLGPINGNPSATLRAHCNIDGEFALWTHPSSRVLTVCFAVGISPCNGSF